MARMSRWLRMAVAAATVILLALTAWQCVDIYRENAFSRETVAGRLRMLALPWTIYAAMAITAAVMGGGKEKIQPMTPENRLRLAKARVRELPEGAVREEKLRRWIWLSAGAAVIICAVFSLIFLLNGGNFVSWDLEMVMGELMLHVGPWVVMALMAVCGASYMCAESIERELAALKTAPKCAHVASKPLNVPVNVVRAVIFVLAAALIGVGIMNGGMRDVLVKAINICTECIGLG